MRQQRICSIQWEAASTIAHEARNTQLTHNAHNMELSCGICRGTYVRWG